MKFRKLFTLLLIVLSLVGGDSLSSLSASANTTHTYHAQMVSKSFSSYYRGNPNTHPLEAINHKADNWVDSVSNIGDYKVHTNVTIDNGNYGYIETVNLVKKHKSFTDKVLTKIYNVVSAIRGRH